MGKRNKAKPIKRGEKYCPACNLDRPKKLFGVSRKSHDGRTAYCRPCGRAYQIKYHKENPQYRERKRSQYKYTSTIYVRDPDLSYLEDYKRCDVCEKPKASREFDGNNGTCRNCLRIRAMDTGT